MQRRDCFRQLMGLVASSPLWAQQPGPDDVMGPINIHEFEDAAKRKMHRMARMTLLPEAWRTSTRFAPIGRLLGGWRFCLA